MIEQQRLAVGSLVSLTVLVAFYQQKVYASFIRDIALRKPPKLEPSSDSFCPITLDEQTLHQPVINVQFDLIWREDVARAATQAFVVGSFLLSVPAGVVADIFGGRWLAGVALTLLSVSTLTLPALRCDGPYCFLFGTLCQGAALATVIAGSTVLLAHWAPRSERSTFVGVVFAMKPFGSVLGLLHLRLFRDLELAWTAVGYSAGALGLVCSAAVLALAHDTPGQCRCVSEAERRLLWIETDVVNFSRGKTDQKGPVPLKQMFSSKPFLSAMLFQFGCSWVRVVLASRVHTYLTHVLHVTGEAADVALAFSSLALGVSSAAGGVASDRLVNGDFTSRTASRKLFGLAGNVLAPPLLLASLAAGCDGATACALFVVASYAHGLVDCSIGAAALDLAPRHAAVSAAVFNCAHACAELFNSELFAAVCEDGVDRREWATFHLAGAAVALACSPPFLLFGSAEVQPYNGWDGVPAGRARGDSGEADTTRDDETDTGPSTEK